MSLALTAGSVVASGGQQIALSSLFSLSSTNNPTYLLVSGLDRNEYTAASNGNMGSISGNGHTLGFSSDNGYSDGADGSGFGILFTYNASTGQYVNAQYGNLSSMVMTASTDKGRNETLSFYGSNDASVLTQNQNDWVGLLVNASSSYLGTVDVVTQPSYGAAPAQATPNSVAAIAQTFVGQAWNSSGCWVLACNITAEAGASLPVVSSVSGVGGQANSEWTVAYSGPDGSTGDWKSMVRTGDVVVITTAGGTGHITTVVSGSGSTAQLVDNAEFVNSSGQIANSAHDGSANDIVIAAPHAASGEFNGVSASSVVIYRLDTPVLTAAVSNLSLSGGQSVALSSLITGSDPANKAITTYQLYDTTAQDSFSVGGSSVTASSASSAITLSAAQMGATSIKAGPGGSSVMSGTLMVRAYNGSYWGDWTQVNVGVTPPNVGVSAAYVMANMPTLTAAVVAGNLSTIALTDSGKPLISLSLAQYLANKPLIDKIQGSFVLSVTATGGNSTVIGGHGTNQLSAGTTGGSHLLAAGASTNGHDTISGGIGSDTITGSTSAAGAALLVAGSGANVVYGGLGADTLYGGGASTLVAEAGYQTLLGGYSASAHDTMYAAAAGHTFMAVAGGVNVLNAGAGQGNVLEGGTGADRLFGSTAATGSAILIGGRGAETVTGGFGADTLVGGGSSLLVAGASAKSQVLLGGYGSTAHDTLAAGSDNAILAVANGRNTLLAGTGRATVFGGAGTDVIAGGGGAGVLIGGSGHTTIMGGAGSDTMVGGGQSVLVGGSGTAGTSVLLGGYSASAHDTLIGGTGSAETLAVMLGNNTLYADPKAQGSWDTLVAGSGNDTLFGAGYGSTSVGGPTCYVVGQGNSSIYGGAGTDAVTVTNGQGNVFFDGGAGANSVTFAGASEADASFSTNNAGVTTIRFDNSARVVTLAHVSSVGFTASGTVHSLAA